MTDIEATAKELVELEERHAEIGLRIKHLRQALVDAVEVGGIVAVGDMPLYKVNPGRRTFKEDLARERLPAEVLDACTVAKIDGAKVKHLSPAVWESCCTQGEAFLAKVSG